MLLIKSKWVNGEQMLGKTVKDSWKKHLEDAGIKFEIVNEVQRKRISAKDNELQAVQGKGDSA